VAAQGGSLVIAPEQAALLQDWDDIIDERIELCWQHCRHDVEAVCGAAFHPVFDNVGPFARPALALGLAYARLRRSSSSAR
jgi:hypothetical protein